MDRFILSTDHEKIREKILPYFTDFYFKGMDIEYLEDACSEITEAVLNQVDIFVAAPDELIEMLNEITRN